MTNFLTTKEEALLFYNTNCLSNLMSDNRNEFKFCSYFPFDGIGKGKVCFSTKLVTGNNPSEWRCKKCQGKTGENIFIEIKK